MAGNCEAEDSALQEKTEEKTKVEKAKSSYQVFLESLRHSSTQHVTGELRDFLNDFVQDQQRYGTSPRLQAATRLHDFLAAATPKLLATEAFAGSTSEEAKLSVADSFEKFVVTKLHKVLFRSFPEDVASDELVDTKLQEKHKSHSRDVFQSLTPEAQASFELAMSQIKKVDQYKAPSDMLICLLNAYRLAYTLSEDLRSRRDESSEVEARSPDSKQDGEDSTGAMSEAPYVGKVLEALLIEALPTNFHSSIEYAAAFRHPPRLSAEERRCLNDFSSALTATTGCTPSVPVAVIGAGGTWGSFEELPKWLVDTGVTFRFENVEAGNLLIEEVDELLVAYQKLAGVLQSLAASPVPAK